MPLSASLEQRLLPGVLSVPSDELLRWLHARNEPPYRVKQIRRWILLRRASSFEQMTDLPVRLRAELAAHFRVLGTELREVANTTDGTSKLLVGLVDGRAVECVLMRTEDRRTVCVSTQVGCAMGCVFCASGLEGVERNLEPYEILEQFLHATRLLGPQERLTHAVIMGMGEPLANLNNLLAALEVVCSRDGLGLSRRRVTISTVGLPAAIRRLADLGVQYHLAISLHAPTDTLRNQIVPVNRKVGVEELVAAGDYYFEKTGRQVTYEYVLLKGINDTIDCARRLAELLRGRSVHINLIPYNPVESLNFETPSPHRVRQFTDYLRSRGFVVHVRRTKGREISAACGQLRLRHKRGQAAASPHNATAQSASPGN